MGDNEGGFTFRPFGTQRELFNTDSKRRKSPAPPSSSAPSINYTISQQLFTVEDVRIPDMMTPLSKQTTPITYDWPEDLLKASQDMLPYITSMNGLQTSAQFQQHIREKSSPFYKEAVDNKLETYKELRRIDPQGFRALWTRSDMREYDTLPAPLWMLALEYFLSLTTTLLVGLWALTEQEDDIVRWLPVMLWVLLQLRAWWRGCSSAYGALLGLYLVHDKALGPEGEHQVVAGGTAALLTQVSEFLYLVFTFGMGALASSVMLWVQQCRCSVGQRLVGVHAVREVTGPVQHSRYQLRSAAYPATRVVVRKTPMTSTPLH